MPVRWASDPRKETDMTAPPIAPRFLLQHLPAHPPGGFTLIEMLVTTTILALLASVALPSFNGALERYRVSAVVNELAASLNLARIESIKRSGNVRMARLTGRGCPALSGRSMWSCGWQIFWDANANNKLDQVEEVIQEFRITNGITVSYGRNLAGINANRWGQIGGNKVLAFQVFPQSGATSDATMTLCRSPVGRIHKAKGSVAC
jgi:type IV fimbrial biogenesis protein FimT